MTKKPPGFFRKLRRLTLPETLTLAEAMVLVVLAAPVVRFAPFPFLGRLASGAIRQPEGSAAKREALILRVRWAVVVAAKRSPFRAKCFECGLTAQLMLRRRGIDSTLHFGAAPNATKGLEAHVWVVADQIDVSGGDVAALYAPLAVFPNVRPAPPAKQDPPRLPV